MRHFFGFLLFALFASPVMALASFPDSLCVADSRCTDVQVKLVEDYHQGEVLQKSSPEILFQGGCYMLSSTYSPTVKHHGYIYFRREKTGLAFYGTFSFFYPESPYQNMTVKEASDRHSGPGQYFASVVDDAWKIEVNTANEWRYFLRRSSLDGKIILLGQWGRNDSILCEMKQNF